MTFSFRTSRLFVCSVDSVNFGISTDYVGGEEQMNLKQIMEQESNYDVMDHKCNLKGLLVLKFVNYWFMTWTMLSTFSLMIAKVSLQTQGPSSIRSNVVDELQLYS